MPIVPSKLWREYLPYYKMYFYKWRIIFLWESILHFSHEHMKCFDMRVREWFSVRYHAELPGTCLNSVRLQCDSKQKTPDQIRFFNDFFLNSKSVSKLYLSFFFFSLSLFHVSSSGPIYHLQNLKMSTIRESIDLCFLSSWKHGGRNVSR